MRTLVVIPARIQSKRLPGKPLRHVDGETLISAVVRQVLAFGLDAEVVVATDSERVRCAVGALTASYLTTGTYRNGTERVAGLVLNEPRFADVEVVVNVQGDQLFLPEYAVKGPLQYIEQGLAEIGTAVAPLALEARANPNRVKALVAPYTQRCLGFYRLLALQERSCLGAWPVAAEHIGVYVYSRAALEKWVALPTTPLEFELSLEQVRPLLAGMVIKAAWVERLPVVVDTEEDLRLVVQAFGKKELRGGD